MTVTVSKNFVCTDAYIGRKGETLEVPEYIGRAWIASHAARIPAEEQPAKDKPAKRRRAPVVISTAQPLTENET